MSVANLPDPSSHRTRAAVFGVAANASVHAPSAEGSTADGPANSHEGRLRTTLDFRHAGRHEVDIAYECTGPAHAPLLVVCGGISAHRHVAAHAGNQGAGWWDAQVGPTRAIDTGALRVLAIDWVGADGRFDHPIDCADQADAIAAVLQFLGIGKVAALLGASYGAMVGLHFAARHGHLLGHLIAISGAHRAHAFASASRALQRNIVRSASGGLDNALSLARQLAMLGYRTPEEFAERFSERPRILDGRVLCAADAYLNHCGERFARGASATAYLRLSESVDLHAIEPATVRVPTTLVAVAEDRVVPSADIHALAAGLGARRIIHHVSSRCGHDAFLADPALIERILRDALADALADAHTDAQNDAHNHAGASRHGH